MPVLSSIIARYVSNQSDQNVMRRFAFGALPLAAGAAVGAAVGAAAAAVGLAAGAAVGVGAAGTAVGTAVGWAAGAVVGAAAAGAVVGAGAAVGGAGAAAHAARNCAIGSAVRLDRIVRRETTRAKIPSILPLLCDVFKSARIPLSRFHAAANSHSCSHPIHVSRTRCRDVIERPVETM